MPAADWTYIAHRPFTEILQTEISQLFPRSILPRCVQVGTLRAARSEDPWALKRRFVMFT